MFLLFFSIMILLLVFSCVYFSLFSLHTRKTVVSDMLDHAMKILLSTRFMVMLLYFLFIFFMLANILGNIPINPIPTMYYGFTVSLSLLFWVAIMVCVVFTQPVSFMAHMMPFGAPMSLGLFLPLVEIFSQLIRPFTLMIRLSTNLSSGHIMMFMFSYFTTLTSLFSPFIFVVMSFLLLLEFCISLLQAYIFVSLISLYLNETI